MFLLVFLFMLPILGAVYILGMVLGFLFFIVLPFLIFLFIFLVKLFIGLFQRRDPVGVLERRN